MHFKWNRIVYIIFVTHEMSEAVERKTACKQTVREQEEKKTIQKKHRAFRTNGMGSAQQLNQMQNRFWYNDDDLCTWNLFVAGRNKERWHSMKEIIGSHDPV